MSNRLLAVVLTASALVLAWAVGAWCDDARLTVVQDETSMERVIERYLKENHQLIIEEKTLDSDDLYLELPFKGDPMPKFRMAIDTQPLNRGEDGEVIERGVLVNLYTDVRIPKEDFARAMEAINDWNRKKAFSSIYIDTDGEVVCCWILNVLPEGLPTEYVYDTVARLQNIWKGLYPVLMEATSQSN